MAAPPAAGPGVERLLPGADTGTRRFHYLSHAASKAYRERHMPHQVTLHANARGDGLPTLAYSKFPLWATHTGYHPPPCSRRRRVKSELDTFGPGVELYFKFLKYAAVLFGVMSLLTIPAVVLFYSGDGMATSASGSGSGEASYVSALSLLSLGNLGDATTVYGDGYERDAAGVRVACPAGMRMLRLEAFYGDLAGSLGCPARQTPSGASKLSCDDVLSGETCLPGPETPGRPAQPPYYCHLSNNRPISLPSSSRFTAGPCCAAQLVAGREDFGALDIKVVGGCEANRARVSAIASGLCLGRTNCTLSPARGAVHTWTPSRDYYNACPGQLLDTQRECSETWLGASAAAGAGLAWCNASAPRAGDGSYYTPAPTPTSSAAFRTRGARLVVVAKCFTETIRPAWWLAGSTPLSKQTVALIVIGFELLLAITFLAGWALLTQREGQAVFPSAQITVADYTLMVTSLPPHDDIKQLEADLRTHLETTLSAAPAVSRSDLPKIAVADINFALRNTDLFDLFTLRGATLHQIERLSKVALLAERSMMLDPRSNRWRGRGGASSRAEDAPPPVDEAQHEGFSRAVQFIRLLRSKLEALDARIDAAEARVIAATAAVRKPGSEHGRAAGASTRGKKEAPPVTAVVAFVTFEEEEGVLRARAAYQDSNLWSWLCQRRELRLHGVHRLSMARAPEPSDIRWENYRLDACQQLSRRAATALLLLVVLLASAYGIFAADGARRLAAKTYPEVNCAATFKDTVGNRALVEQDLLMAAGVGVSGRLGCYCKNLLATSGVSAVFNDKFTLSDGSTDTLCVTWFSNFVSVNALIYGVSLVVLVFNIVLRVIIYALVSLERHTTVSSEVRVRASYLLLVQFVNTGVLVTLLNAYIDTDFALLRGGQFWDFSAGWYSTVGTSITLTMLLQVATIHLSPLLFGVLKSMRRCWDRRLGCDRSVTRAKTQGELNELYMGIEFALDERYAQLYTATFVIMTYSTGLPLLMPVLAVTFALTYAVDKALFLRHYNSPPYFDASLGRRLTSLLPVAMLAHIGFGIWQLSSADMFPGITSFVGLINGYSSTSEELSQKITNGLNTPQIKIGERLLTWHVIPLSILLAMLVIMLTWQHLLLVLVQRLGSVLCCCAAASVERCLRSEPQAAGLPNYFMAIPPDVIDEVTSGSRRVKPYLAKKLADMRAAHHAVKEKATLTTLLASYERLNGVLNGLKALRADVQAQADTFLHDVHAICDAESAATAGGPDAQPRRASQATSASPMPRDTPVSRGGDDERSRALGGDSVAADDGHAPVRGEPVSKGNSAALATALRMYARNAPARSGVGSPRHDAQAGEPPSPAVVAADDAPHSRVSDAAAAAAAAVAATADADSAVVVEVEVDGGGGGAGDAPVEAANNRSRSASLAAAPVDALGGGDGGGVATDVAAVAVAVADDDEPTNPDDVCGDAAGLAAASAPSASAASVEVAAIVGVDSDEGTAQEDGDAHGGAAPPPTPQQPSSVPSHDAPATTPASPARSTPPDSAADDGLFLVTPGMLAQLRIPLDDASELRPEGEPATLALVAAEAAAAEEGEEGEEADVLAVPRSRLLSPSTLTDVHALRERLLGSLTLPPECALRITRPEAAEHAQSVLGTIDYVLAHVANRGLQLYTHISQGIDRKNAQRAQFASGGAAATLDGAMSFLTGLTRRVMQPPLAGGAPPAAAADAATAAAAGAATGAAGGGGGRGGGASTAAAAPGGSPAAADGPRKAPRRSLLQRFSLGGGRKSDKGSGAASSAAPSRELDVVDNGLIVGVWCYDLQEAPRLRVRFGLEAAVSHVLKRRMALTSLRTGGSTRSLAAVVGGDGRKPAPPMPPGGGATMESVADSQAPTAAAARHRAHSRRNLVATAATASSAADAAAPHRASLGADAAWASHVVAAAGRSQPLQPPPPIRVAAGHPSRVEQPVGYSPSGYPIYAPGHSRSGGGGGGGSRGGGSRGSGSRGDESASAAPSSSSSASAPAQSPAWQPPAAARGGAAWQPPALFGRAGSFGRGGARHAPPPASGYMADAAIHTDSLDATAAYVGGQMVSLPPSHRFVFPDQQHPGRRGAAAAAVPPRPSAPPAAQQQQQQPPPPTYLQRH